MTAIERLEKVRELIDAYETIRSNIDCYSDELFIMRLFVEAIFERHTIQEIKN